MSFTQTLLPTLFQCFGTIFVGYLFGRCKLLAPREMKGLNVCVHYLFLPALIFLSVSTISFRHVCWAFVASVFVAKAVVFVGVSCLAVLLTGPVDLGRAGIFAISATQSNDFALAYPLLVALYEKIHPDLPGYVYVIAPVQLIALNSIGFFLLELELQRVSSHSHKQFLFAILKGTVFNPIIVTTLLGLIWNFTYGNTMLPLFEVPLKGLGAAFRSCALLLLGYTIAEKSKMLNEYLTLPTVLLALAKILLLPILLQKLSLHMLKGYDGTTVEKFSTFGFLYGTIPTAPTSFVFAAQYQNSVEEVSATIILSTFLSAPLMLVSATMISMAQQDFKNLGYYLTQTISYTSAFNMLCCIWFFITLIVVRQWHKLHFRRVTYIIVAQSFTSLGGLLLFLRSNERTILFYCQYAFSTFGNYATTMYAFFLSMFIFYEKHRPLCLVHSQERIHATMVVICFLLPAICCIVIALTFKHPSDEPTFQLGYAQIVATFVITLLCFVSTIVCLTLQHCKRHPDKLENNINSPSEACNLIDSEESHDLIDELDTHSKTLPCTSTCTCRPIIKPCGASDLESFKNVIEESICTHSGEITHSHYRCNDDSNECHQRKITAKSHFNRHCWLLISLVISMLLTISVCLWKLTAEPTNGIYIELEFMNAILSHSQAIVCFVIFSLDGELFELLKAKCIHHRC